MPFLFQFVFFLKIEEELLRVNEEQGCQPSGTSANNFFVTTFTPMKVLPKLPNTLFIKGHVLFMCMLLFAQSVLFSGCGYMALTQRSEFVPITEGVAISIADTEDGTYSPIQTQHGKVKLDQYHRSYFVKQSKEEHIDRTTEIKRSKRNYLKVVDILAMITIDIVVTAIFISRAASSLSYNAEPADEISTGTYALLGVGILGWAVVLPAPGELYPEMIELPELDPVLIKDTAQLFLTSGEHEITLRKKGIRVRDHSEMKDHNRGYNYTTRDSTEAFDFIQDLDLYPIVADELDEIEYGIDSAKANIENTLRIDSRIESIMYMQSGDKLKCELKMSWALETTDQLQYLYARSFRTDSEWMDFSEIWMEEGEQKEAILGTLQEALQVNLHAFLSMDTVQSILSAPVPIPLMDVEELKLYTNSTFSSSVSESVKAVVTIVSNEGHGSGCIVTPDGYIVTNAHVVVEDTTDLRAIFSDDVGNEIPLKFVRMNEAMDLALLKIDTTGLVPLALGTKEDIETGADVYAIGTPADVELGQTVTRGIISGKRKFGGHAFIQTDVGISAGNSGGALITTNGVLLGIVTSELKNRKIDDIGFAIPAHLIEGALKIKLK